MRNAARASTQSTIAGAMALRSNASIHALLEVVERPLGRTPTALTDGSGKPPPMAGINAFVASSNSDGCDLRIHLVNFDVPLGEHRTDPPRAVRDLVAAVPLPAKWSVTSVRAFSPHPGEELAMKYEQQGDILGLEIARLDLYKVVRISGRPNSPLNETMQSCLPWRSGGFPTAEKRSAERSWAVGKPPLRRAGLTRNAIGCDPAWRRPATITATTRFSAHSP